MLKQPLYYDSQAAAAAALNIDIYEIRVAKRQGCPAFRSGRVYRRELLDWLAKHRPHALRRGNDATPFPLEPANTGNEKTDRALDVAGAIVALTHCANRGLIADDRYLEIGTEIVRSITDELKEWPEGKPLLDDWAEKVLGYLFSEFGHEENLEAAHKTHPKLVGWLCRVAGAQGVEYGGKKYRTD